MARPPFGAAGARTVSLPRAESSRLSQIQAQPMELESIFVHSDELDENGYPPACPFNTHRAGLTRNLARQMGFLGTPGRREVAPVAATREELEAFHTPVYLDVLQRGERGELGFDAFEAGVGTLDCPIFPRMYRYSALAAGGTLTAARHLRAGGVRAAFNPSGGFHHAMPDRASGFCYLNDVVLGAQCLAEGGRRVLVLDIDAHHSDGVQRAFYDRRDVFVISIHESGRTLFPGTGFTDEIGEGDGVGFTVNVPLPTGTPDAVYERVLSAVVWPLVEAFAPDFIVVELGMDTLAGDPLAHLRLSNNVPADAVRQLLRRERPILAVGGGGYNVDNTVRAWVLCWSILCGANDGWDDAAALGGVMLQNTDWVGGLRDRPHIVDAANLPAIRAEVTAVIDDVRRRVFPFHGLG